MSSDDITVIDNFLTKENADNLYDFLNQQALIKRPK